MKYYGITYPSIFTKKPIKWLWRKFCCKRQWHLWDEVKSDPDHYLVCDACQLEVFIERIDTTYLIKKEK